jgi:hypothetical protein
MFVQRCKRTLQSILLLSLGSQVASSPSLDKRMTLTTNPDDINGAYLFGI